MVAGAPLSTTPPPGLRRVPPALAAGLLALATLAAYEPARENGFVRFDDQAYVTENPEVLAGITRPGVAWAFTTGHAANWHPLTWLSHMLDVELFGLDPAGHHATSVVLHAASAVLLLVFLARASGALLPSAFVAGVFALHPLHVESVAWAAERKDVLSVALGFASLAFWAAWTRGGGRGRYLAALALYALSLMAKPTLVCLPLLLLALDLWPLSRWRPGARFPVRLLSEKLPFAALALASCAITLAVQSEGGAMDSLPPIPPAMRATNAFAAAAGYLGRALWPARLSAFYPYPLEGVPAAQAALAGGGLWIATVLALKQARARPWIAAGWLWYLAALLPVIGIVQVGRQASADRYTYVALVGPSIALAFGLRGIARPRVLAAGGLLALLACLALTRAQVRVWRDDLSLWRHAREATGASYLVQFNLAAALRRAGRTEEALAAYEAGFALHPAASQARNDCGEILLELGRIDEAVLHFQAALEVRPDFPAARSNLERARARERP